MQWSQQDIPDDVRLVCVSIGVPEKGRALEAHLGLPSNMLLVDPENACYDAIQLNRGVDRTFFNINTPFAFLDRFTKKDGMKDLFGVLGKWSKGTCRVSPSPVFEGTTLTRQP